MLALALAVVLYAATSLPHGSGFLAVFVAGSPRRRPTPYKREIERFHTRLARLAEIVVFVALGLTVDLGSLAAHTGCGGAHSRSCSRSSRVRSRSLSPSHQPAVSRRAGVHRLERTQGRRADPARAFAVLGGVPTQTVYGLVFVVVLLSVLGQGTLVPRVAGRLGIPMHEQPLRPWQLSVGLSEKPHGVRLSVTADATADGQTIADLQLQPGDWVSLIVRDGRPLSPEDPRRLAPATRSSSSLTLPATNP